MFAPNVTDAERDVVIRCVRGDTLLALVDSCVRSGDIAGLRALERQDVFALALLTEAHVQMGQTGQVGQGRGANEKTNLSPFAMPMLNALGAVFSHVRQAQPVDPRVPHVIDPANNPDQHRWHWSLDIHPDIVDLVQREVDRGISHVASGLKTGRFPAPGGHWGAGGTMRQHLAALAALAVATDSGTLLEKIKRIDPDALFHGLPGELLQERQRTMSISPWGLAVSWNRAALLATHFDPKAINRRMATEPDHDCSRDLYVDDLLIPRSSSGPINTELTLWVIKNLTALRPEDLPEYERTRPHPSERLVYRLFQAGQHVGWSWSWLMDDVIERVPEFCGKHLTAIIETIQRQEDGNADVLRKVLESVDWAQWDEAILNNKLAAQTMGILARMPDDHPVQILMRNVHSSSTEEMDKDMVVLLNILSERGRLRPLLDGWDACGDPTEPIAHTLAAHNLVLSLECLLHHGMVPNVKGPPAWRKGLSLMDYCEAHDKDGPVLPLLRAEVARQEARSAIDRLLNHDSALMAHKPN